MHHKNIRRILKKQLKRNHPHWKKLPKKDKKAIVKNALEEAVREYDFSQTVDAPLEELIEIEGQLPTAGIMNLKEMAEFIDCFNKDRLIDVKCDDRISRYIQDDELKFIHNLLDDRIINALLSYHGYTPSMRDFFRVNFFEQNCSRPSNTRSFPIVNSVVMNVWGWSGNVTVYLWAYP